MLRSDTIGYAFRDEWSALLRFESHFDKINYALNNAKQSLCMIRDRESARDSLSSVTNLYIYQSESIRGKASQSV
jgi:hypothetical protein